MKTMMLAATLSLLLAGGVFAESPPDDAVTRDVRNLQHDIEDLTARLNKIEDRLDTVEARLGRTFRAPSPFDNVERRLDDLEKDVQDRKRRR